jgi:HD-GYP domain-containing protein (c-di-GMP phosphodiesterase class II)
MREARAPQGTEWNDAVEALHGLTNALMVRQLYRDGHPAIARADDGAAHAFHKLLEPLPELVVALIDGEFVVCERPMPELRARLGTLAAAMERLETDCLVFQRGMAKAECSLLASTLAATSAGTTAPKQLREHAQTQLPHVLLRFAELRAVAEDERRKTEAFHFVPLVATELADVLGAIRHEATIERRPLLELAERIVRACEEGLFQLEPIAYAPGFDNEPAHATNVAMMTAAMGLVAGIGETVCIDVTAAALVHDLGRRLLPDDCRGIPEPLLVDRPRATYRHHPFAGAAALLASGAPPLWIAAALEHHRGVDGEGYPALASKAPPDPLVRMIALASFVDAKCTRLPGGVGDDPLRALEAARALEGRFFGARELQLFTRALGSFPPGTAVELSDRRAAIVTRANARMPQRPQVRIVCGDGEGKRADLSTFDAVEDRHHLSIVRAIAPPLVLRAPPAGTPASAPPPARTEASEPELEGEVDVVVIDAVEVPRAPLDAPGTRPPPDHPPTRPSSSPLSRWPTRSSGSYSSIGEVEPEPTRPPAPAAASIAPPRSLPPAAPKPLHRASTTRLPVVAEPKRATPAATAAPADVVGEKIPVLLVTPSELAKLPLDHRAGFVLSMLDGQTTIEGLVDASGMPTEEVLAIVEHLLAMSVIKLR